ncbi:hypothetical protein OSTOST_08282 [Ostertagia ostertagi]
MLQPGVAQGAPLGLPVPHPGLAEQRLDQLQRPLAGHARDGVPLVFTLVGESLTGTDELRGGLNPTRSRRHPGEDLAARPQQVRLPQRYQGIGRAAHRIVDLTGCHECGREARQHAPPRLALADAVVQVLQQLHRHLHRRLGLPHLELGPGHVGLEQQPVALHAQGLGQLEGGLRVAQRQFMFTPRVGHAAFDAQAPHPVGLRQAGFLQHAGDLQVAFGALDTAGLQFHLGQVPLAGMPMPPLTERVEQGVGQHHGFDRQRHRHAPLAADPPVPVPEAGRQHGRAMLVDERPNGFQVLQRLAGGPRRAKAHRHERGDGDGHLLVPGGRQGPGKRRPGVRNLLPHQATVAVPRGIHAQLRHRTGQAGIPVDAVRAAAQPLQREGPGRLQHAKARPGAGLAADERTLHEQVQVLDQVDGAVIPHQQLRRLQAEAGREQRQLVKQLLGRRGQQLVAPFQCRLQAAVPAGRSAHPAGQQAQPVRQAAAHAREPEHRHAGGCELERQRHAVELAADLDHLGQILGARLEVPAHRGADALQHHADSAVVRRVTGIGGRRDLQRAQPDDPLPRHAQGLLAGGCCPRPPAPARPTRRSPSWTPPARAAAPAA